MTFIAAKVFWLLAKPSNLIALLLVAGLVALWLRRTRLGASLIALGAAPLAALAFLPLGAWLLIPLENRFPPPADLPERVDGVVVLGGAVGLQVTAARDQAALNDSVERLTAMIELGRRYPEARLVFTGGSALLLGPPMTEAAVMRDFLTAQGFDTNRVAFEGEARDTRENALFSKQLVEPQPGEQWLLVTSAFHMPRSMGVFRAAGWPGLIPYPVDYRTTGRFSLAWSDTAEGAGSRLADLDAAAREWVGLLAYRLMGRTAALFPSPR